MKPDIHLEDVAAGVELEHKPPEFLSEEFPAKPAEGSSLPLRPHWILVVDDEEEIRSSIFASLDRAGFAVATATGARVAWEMILQEHYDLVVTADEMPGMTGAELIERMDEAGLDLPVIVLSSITSADCAGDCAEGRVAAVLPKRSRDLQLLDTVQQVLPGPHGDHPASAVSGRR